MFHSLRSFPFFGFLAGALMILALPIRVTAQDSGGTVAGRVTLETSGDPVHGATVVIVGARRTVTTGDDGKFTISAVPPGTYEVLAQREHLTASRQSVTITAGQTATVEFKLVLAAVHEELTVTANAVGAATTFESFNAVTSLDSVEIARRLGATLADVLQDEPGIAKRTFGPGTSRPIIRGFDGDRVLILQDGLRTADLSSQSGDHGVSIEPSGLARIEVVKGPATLLYGSNAIGGVVNAITAQDAFRTTPFAGTLGGVNFDTGSANMQAGGSANVQHGQGPVLLYGNVTARRTGDYDSPEGTIPNSATRLVTGEGGVGWTGRRAFFGVGAGLERNRYGIPFAGELEGEADAQIDLEIKRQNVRFDTGLRNLSNGFVDTVKLTANYVDYQHDEIEIADAIETLGTRFKNQVWSLRAEVEQKRSGRFAGRLGVEGLARDYSATGAEALTPDTTQHAFAAFVYEEVSLGRPRLQLGGRFDHAGYEAKYADGPLTPSFNGASGSIGLHTPVGGSNAIVVNVTASSRAPALEELFNFGPHPGNLAFEIGDPDLKMERSVGLDASFRRRAGRVSGEINGFVYDISNFVFLDVTDEIEDGLRVSNYMQADSKFSGIEAASHFDLHPNATLNLSLGYVRARLTGTDEALPRIPPFHGRAELSVKFGGFHVGPEVVFSSKQDRVFRDETPTDAWATVNVGASWQHGSGHGSHLIAFEAYNLGNTTYRLHTSFLKDLAPEMGRGVKLTYSVRFF
jgi:iron complex outermembrane recepter protein